MQQTYSDVILGHFLKLIDDEIKDRTGKVCMGNGIASFDDYRNRVGVLTGLALARELLEEAQRQIDART
jgi:hypothetical protein